MPAISFIPRAEIMLRDALDIDAGATLTADLCIVGAGPAGLVLARELADTGAAVLCLESGGCVAEDDAQDLNEGSFIGAPYAGLRQTRHRQVGGTACVWNTPLPDSIGAKYVPLDPCDLEPAKDGRHTGWPLISLASDYRRAQELCGLGPFAYDGDAWAGHDDLALPDTRLRAAVYQFGPADVFTRSHLRMLEGCENVTVLYHATMCALALTDGGRTVTGVRVSTPRGTDFRVRAGLVVLAGGAIENARMLLACREPGQAAPGNAGGWLGCGFMEHPRDTTLWLRVRDEAVFARAAFFDRHVAGDGTVIGGRIALSRQAVDDGLPNASVTLLPRPHPPGRIARLARLAARRLGLDPGAPGGYGWSDLADPGRHFIGFRLLLNLEQRPWQDNRLVLDGSRDPHGIPRVRVEWRWREEEAAGLARLREVLCEALSAHGVGTVEREPVVPPDASAHHHAGTTRMSATPEDGVVDVEGRVHGTGNLYVTGSSLFPSSGFANPTLTIVALASRLARHLRSRL